VNSDLQSLASWFQICVCWKQNCVYNSILSELSVAPSLELTLMSDELFQLRRLLSMILTAKWIFDSCSSPLHHYQGNWRLLLGNYTGLSLDSHSLTIHIFVHVGSNCQGGMVLMFTRVVIDPNYLWFQISLDTDMPMYWGMFLAFLCLQKISQIACQVMISWLMSCVLICEDSCGVFYAAFACKVLCLLLPQILVYTESQGVLCPSSSSTLYCCVSF
jgi:hypothetical protein